MWNFIHWFHSFNKPTKPRAFTLCWFSETLPWCYFTEREKQVWDSNVIFLAQTSPPAVIWWERDRWVAWSTTVRRLKEKPRHGWDWTLPRPCWRAHLYWSPWTLSGRRVSDLYIAPDVRFLSRLIWNSSRGEMWVLSAAGSTTLTCSTRARLDIKWTGLLHIELTSAEKLFIVKPTKTLIR